MLKNKFKNIIKDKNLYYIIFINLIFWGIYANIEYATDTYQVFTRSVKESILHFIACGRFVTAGATLFVYLLNLSHKTIYNLSYILAVVCFIISMYKIYTIINKDLKNNIFSLIISTLIILNIFSIELFMFIEKGILAFSILCVIFALDNMIKYFEGNNKKLILVILFMTLANFSYQGTIGLFIGIGIIYVIKYTTNIKSFIKNNIMLLIGYAVPAIINFLTVRFMFNNSRVDGEYIIGESIKKIIDGSTNMITTTYGILPENMLLICIVTVFIGIILCTILNKKDTINTKCLKIFYTIYIVLGVLLATIAPQILQNTSSIWFVPRSTYTYASLLGILILYFLVNNNMNKKSLKLVIITGSIIFLVIQFYNFQKIGTDHYILNYEDKITTLQIKEMIEEYEVSTGTQVNKIAIYNDMYKTYSYKELFVSGDINIKAYSPDWSIIPILKYYTNRNFEIVEPKEELVEEFKKLNWDYFDEKQIKIENDTLHLCVY